MTVVGNRYSDDAIALVSMQVYRHQMRVSVQTIPDELNNRSNGVLLVGKGLNMISPRLELNPHHTTTLSATPDTFSASIAGQRP